MNVRKKDQKPLKPVKLKDAKPGDNIYLSQTMVEGEKTIGSPDKDTRFTVKKFTRPGEILISPEDKNGESKFLPEAAICYILEDPEAAKKKVGDLKPGDCFRFDEVSEEEALKGVDGASAVWQVLNEQPQKAGKVKISAVDGKSPTRECDADRPVVHYADAELLV